MGREADKLTEEIAWREWGQEAFDEAAATRRPILLDISAVWCHWCHVMDERTYADPEVVARVNQGFIPVRVDTDRRPDVNSRYNMGGWPTTAFLTPQGEILTGTTYLPVKDMTRVLDEVAAFYREHEAELAEPQTGSRLERALARRDNEGGLGGGPGGGLGAGAGTRGLDPETALAAVGEVLSRVTEAYDELYGGFGTAPKFPHAKALDLLLVAHLRGWAENRGTLGPSGAPGTSGAPGSSAAPGAPGSYLTMVERTLQAMRRGGLYDQVAGGFFRYSTTRNWEVPHYEKMLEDNAELLAVYARVARLTGDPFYLETVRDVVRYLTTWLRSPQGYFYGSQDADEAYYKLGKAQRAEREPPRVDETLYVGWNALAVTGFLQAYHATGDVRLRETGLVALEAVWAACRLEDGLVAHYHDEDGPHGPVLLEDAANLSLAFLDAHEATGEKSFLERASELLARTTETFGDEEASAYFDTLPGGEKPGRLRVGQKGLIDNSRLALALLRLADLSEEDRHRALAERTLAYFLGPHRRHGILAAEYALALDWAAGPTAVADVTGRPGDPRVEALRLAAAAAVTAAAVVRWAPEGGEGRGIPLVSVCVDGRCLVPVSDPDEVAAALRRVARRDGVASSQGEGLPGAGGRPGAGERSRELPGQPS